MEFKTLLERDFILLDGAMGTMLQQKGMQPGSIPELLNLQKPQWIEEIHTSYLQSGAHAEIPGTGGLGSGTYRTVVGTYRQLIL